MTSPPLPLLRFPALLVCPSLCVLSGQLPFCRSVTWDSLHLHGRCPVRIARCASPDQPRPLLWGTPWWNAAGASCSAARRPCLAARLLLICGLICWILCLVMLSLPHRCARHCMLTPLAMRLFTAAEGGRHVGRARKGARAVAHSRGTTQGGKRSISFIPCASGLLEEYSGITAVYVRSNCHCEGIPRHTLMKELIFVPFDSPCVIPLHTLNTFPSDAASIQQQI
jgi:hypothetical protein